MYEMANLWKGSWAVSKGVNDLDWGVGGVSSPLDPAEALAYDKKIVTATPSGNFMLFDLNKSKLGEYSCWTEADVKRRMYQVVIRDLLTVSDCVRHLLTAI